MSYQCRKRIFPWFADIVNNTFMPSEDIDEKWLIFHYHRKNQISKKYFLWWIFHHFRRLVCLFGSARSVEHNSDVISKKGMKIHQLFSKKSWDNNRFTPGNWSLCCKRPKSTFEVLCRVLLQRHPGRNGLSMHLPGDLCEKLENLWIIIILGIL